MKRNYSVPVLFQAGGENAAEARQFIETMLLDLKRLYNVTPFVATVQGDATLDDLSDVVVSDALKAYLISEINQNDNDVSGWETDLDWCLGTFENLEPTDPDYPGEALNAELLGLIALVGGSTKAAEVLGDEDEDEPEQDEPDFHWDTKIRLLVNVDDLAGDATGLAPFARGIHDFGDDDDAVAIDRLADVLGVEPDDVIALAERAFDEGYIEIVE